MALLEANPLAGLLQLLVEYFQQERGKLLIGSPCRSPEQCTVTWRVGPDGDVTGTAPDSTIDALLMDFELEQLWIDVDGVGLRKGLRDGIPCVNDTVLDLSVSFNLTLSTETLTKDVTGCISGQNSIADAHQIVSKY